MFLQWCRDELVLSFIFVQRFSTWTGRGFEKAPLQKHKRYAQAPRTRRILKPQNEIHPAPLLICFAAFQIGSALRGDGDAVGNFFTTPRFTAPGQGRRRTRHGGRFFGP
ncbi:MAG: hypothetical protein KA713_09955 [Chryseotalea sp. WA131a]|nr:MAG: hypothetical protein KA713_09955 [Chryseotalea sp. WA131a]